MFGCVYAHFLKPESAFWNAHPKRRFKTPFIGVLFMLNFFRGWAELISRICGAHALIRWATNCQTFLVIEISQISVLIPNLPEKEGWWFSTEVSSFFHCLRPSTISGRESWKKCWINIMNTYWHNWMCMNLSNLSIQGNIWYFLGYSKNRLHETVSKLCSFLLVMSFKRVYMWSCVHASSRSLISENRRS